MIFMAFKVFGSERAGKKDAPLIPSLSAFGAKTRFDPDEFTFADPFVGDVGVASLLDQITTSSRLLEVADIALTINTTSVIHGSIRTDSCCVPAITPCEDTS